MISSSSLRVSASSSSSTWRWRAFDLACPFSETDRVRLGYIVCPSTSRSVHEEEERSGSSAGWRTDGRFLTRPKPSDLSKLRTCRHLPLTTAWLYRTPGPSEPEPQIACYPLQSLQDTVVSEGIELGAGDKTKPAFADVLTRRLLKMAGT
jgi:hypothetical protein